MANCLFIGGTAAAFEPRSAPLVGVGEASAKGCDGSGNEVAVGVGFRSSDSDTVKAGLTPSGNSPTTSGGKGVDVGSGVGVGG